MRAPIRTRSTRTLAPMVVWRIVLLVVATWAFSFATIVALESWQPVVAVAALLAVAGLSFRSFPVSYTHLTLPTKRIV